MLIKLIVIFLLRGFIESILNFEFLFLLFFYVALNFLFCEQKKTNKKINNLLR